MDEDTEIEPITPEEFADFSQAMDEQAESLRNALAEDLGGTPADYRPDAVAEKYKE